MREICRAADVSFFAPESAYFSFSNSPYIGHRNATAVDIYPIEGEWGCSIPSPVDGEVVDVRKIRMGQKREFLTADFDYAIGIRPSSNADYVVRILHCKPDVKIGDTVNRLGHLGAAIRSRYFNFWTGPHYHAEVMLGDDFARSSQSIPLNIPPTEISSSESDIGEAHVNVIEVTEDRILATGGFGHAISSNGLFGHLLHTNQNPSYGLLDGGIPHYELAGCLCSPDASLPKLYKWSRFVVGRTASSIDNPTRFMTSNNLNFKIGEHRIRGLSFYIFTEYNLIRGKVPLILIPNEYGGFVDKFQAGDTPEIHASIS
ncbi:hypothetical protein EU537_12020 [Candidatus Thorarchaeota archaeon]|nr:MAG: hypothetical protein EU537_12020 [Candidatus Thorarchaeota archaeon]